MIVMELLLLRGQAHLSVLVSEGEPWRALCLPVEAEVHAQGEVDTEGCVPGLQVEGSSPKPASWIRETTRSCPVNLFSPPWLIRHSEDERKKDCQ